MAKAERIDITPENRPDMDLASELGERVGNFCGKKKNKPVGACCNGSMSVSYWCADCLKLKAGERIFALWQVIEAERKAATR